MTSRNINLLKSLLLLIGLGTMAALVGCGSSSKSTPPPPPPAVTVSLSTTPTSLFVNDTTPVTATVANDSANRGVTWSCTPAGSCGTFSSSSSASGVAVVYTAPSSVPASTVEITATSVASSSATKSTPAITINPASGITITLSTPPVSLPTGGNTPITATVNGDSANGGVTWSCAPAGTCGSFSSNTSASGTPVTFTAPATAGNVTITATSVTDNAIHTSTGSIAITKAVAATLADGNYVFSVAGTDSNAGGSGYVYAGVFTVLSGAITGGEQDYSDKAYLQTQEPITGGTITASADGNLIITLNSGDATIGNGTGTTVLNASLVSASKALLTEYDGWASGSGELNLQAASLATPSGAYSFFMSGGDTFGSPLSIGGVINVDGSGTISGTGSIFDVNDACDTKPGGVCSSAIYSAQVLAANTSTVSAPDSLGFVTFQLNSNCTVGTFDPNLCLTGGGITSSLLVDGYMIDATHIRLVENWFNDSLGAFIGGTALGQTGAGAFNTASVSGSTYVVGLTGADSNGTFDVAGLLTFNANNTVSGNLSYNDLVATTAQGGVNITGGTYSVDPTGSVTVTGLTDGTATFDLQLYLTGDGHAHVISMDSTATNPDVLAGLGKKQATSTFTVASLTGSYALNLVETINGAEQDGVGAVFADAASTVNGFQDWNEIFTVGSGTLTTDTQFSANYAVTPTNGVFGISDNGATFNATVYLVDGTQGVVIENDNTQLTLGRFEHQ